MSTVAEATATRLLAARNRAHTALRDFNKLLQDPENDDARSNLQHPSDPIMIDACRMIFGLSPSLFGNVEEITKKLQ